MTGSLFDLKFSVAQDVCKLSVTELTCFAGKRT